MRVVICPDKFAGTLTAVQAAAAIATGWHSVRPDDELLSVPLADGGEGTIEVIAHARDDVKVHTVEVADATGVATQAAWVSVPDGTAVVEAAQACGLSVLPHDARDPLQTTTYGVGQLLAVVLGTRPTRIVVGLGGSATVDGGAGMMSALSGHGVRRADGNGVKVGGRWVAQVAAVPPAPAVPPIVIASDVTNPLLGPDGAAAVFGPQKGADAPAVRELETALHHWADVVEQSLPGGPWRDRPGAGAAGGLGFALMAFLDARMDSGAATVADLIGLDLHGADVVITGEGSLDAQTLAGKGPAEIRSRGTDAGAITVAVAGVISDDAGSDFDIAESLGPDGMTRPSEMVSRAAARAAARLDRA